MQYTRLAQAIQTLPTGRRCSVLQGPVGSPLRFSLGEEVTPSTYHVGVEYKVSVAVEHSVLSLELNLLPNETRTAKRAIIETVFGEFRDDIISLELAIDQHDFNLAKKLLHDLEERMFAL